MNEIISFVANNKGLLLLISLWELVWKGFALWIAARKGDKLFYVLILIINSLGVLPIIYILINKRKK